MSEHQADIVGRNGSALSDLLDAPRLAGAGAPETPRDESTDGPDVVDDVFDEFLMRCQAGEDLDPDRFCDEHPSIQSSLRKVLAAQLACAANPDLLDRPEEDGWPHPGQVFLGLQLRQLLGRGAFARVFLATEEALGGKRVAVKVAIDGGNEAKTLGRLEHPNVVPVHAVREDPETGLTAVIMPYLGSATLHNVLDRVLARGKPPAQGREILEAVWLRGQRLEVRKQNSDGSDFSLTSDLCPLTSDGADPRLWSGTYVEGVVHLAAQVADALEYVHRQGVFHLDLKPSNVLLTPSGRPMLLDFNLAHDRECRRQRLGGTLPYMAPEQLRALAPEVRSQRSEVRGQRSDGTDSSLTSDLCPLTSDLPDIDGRADVFALGVLLYELLAGQHPFGPVSLKQPENEVRAVLLARQEKGAKPLHEANPEVGQRLSRLVHRCLEIDRSRRPARAEELAAELRQTQARQQRGRARHVVALCAVLLATALTVLVVAWLARSGDKGRDLEQGTEALDEQRYEQAVTHLRKALETDPDNPSANFALGRALIKLGKIPQAQIYLQEAERVAPTGKVSACLGYAYSWRGMHDSPGVAVFYYHKALDAGYRTAIVYNNLGRIYTRGPASIHFRTRYALSEWCLNQAITLDPRLWGAYRTRMLLEVNRSAQDSYLPLQGVADVEPALTEGAAPLDYQRAAFLYATAVERAERRFGPTVAVAAAGSWALVGSCVATAGGVRPHRAPAALAGWALVASHVNATGQPRPALQKVLLDLLARPEYYRAQAREYIKRANAGGIGLSQFNNDVYKRLVPLTELKDFPRSEIPPYREPIFDPIDGE